MYLCHHSVEVISTNFDAFKSGFDATCRLHHANLQAALDCAALIDPAGAAGAGYTRCW
jgi:hypothetical protein